MSRKLAIIHTTPVTIESLKALAHEMLTDCEIINFMDDSILPQLGCNGGNVDEVEERLRKYARFAEQAGADCILNACSSVGELVAKVQPFISIPIVRIDEAMAEEAVSRGTRVGVVATLNTTLKPTLNLLKAKAAQIGKTIEFIPNLAEAAYQKLMQGDKEGHDAALVETLTALIKTVDVIVLAQASMARVLPKLPESEQGKFLTSPKLGMERVKQKLEVMER